MSKVYAGLMEESELLIRREKLREVRKVYDSAINSQRQQQREQNMLLQRKHTWQEAEVARFTELFREEHERLLAAQAAKKALEEAETAVEQGYELLVDAIRRRYHEEQVWSDKMRAISAYGTAAVVIANTVLFVVVQIWIEPRRRAALQKELKQIGHQERSSIETRLLEIQQSTQQIIEYQENSKKESEKKSKKSWWWF